MSQQYQPQGQRVQQTPPQGGTVQQTPSFGTQSQQGQAQMQTGQQIQTGQQQDLEAAHFDEALSSEFRAALEDFSWLRKQTKWGAEQAHVRFQGSGVETTLEAISEIAELNEKLILSNSKYVQHQLDAFRKVATDAAQELQQYEQERFVGAIITDLARAIHSVEELLASVQGQQSQIPTQGQPQTQSSPQSQTTPQTQTSPQVQTSPYGQSQY